MQRKILIINQATGYLTIDIVNSFAMHFYEVNLIYGGIRVQDLPLNPKVKLRRVIKVSRISHVRRFFAWIVASLQIFFLLLFKYRKHEVFYFSLPPFAYLGSLLLPNKFSLLMFDVYPDVLKMLDIRETHLVYKTWARWNKKLFAKAHRVYTIGDSLANLMAQYTPKEKINVIPLWTGLTNILPVPKEENPFIAEHQLQGKFIIQYSGNIAGTHNIESLLEVAKIMKQQKDILFLIIGRGQKMPIVANIIKDNVLDNCMLLPFQPDDIIRYSIAAADLSVVLIEDKIAEVSVPSKLYNIMAVGSVVLSISPENSEINKLVVKYSIGANFQHEQFRQMAEFILKVKSSPELIRQYRANSIEASKNHTAANAHKYIDVYLDAEKK